MRIYIAGNLPCGVEERITDEVQDCRLMSYFSISTREIEARNFERRVDQGLLTFVDSGAYSAFNSGVGVDIDEYISWLHANEYCKPYANLDVIGDVEKTWKNQLYMESCGLSPLPCYHYGEPEEWLDLYLDKYDYIALGGTVHVPKAQKVRWMDWVWSKVTDQKIHGYGQTSVNVMFRFPWFSVDSSTWLRQAAAGKIYVPKRRKGEWCLNESPRAVYVSARGVGRVPRKAHYQTMSKSMRDHVRWWVEENGAQIGCSHMEEMNGKEVEVEDVNGVSSDYRERMRLNCIYCKRVQEERKRVSCSPQSPKKGLFTTRNGI